MKIIKISGEIGWSFNARDMERELNGVNEDIEVHIDSIGGSVFEGVKIYNQLRKFKGGKVTVIVGALCASIATYIAMAGDKIKAHDNSTFMIHNAWTYAQGDYRDMANTAEVLEGLTSLIAKKYISKTGINEKRIRKAMDKETWLFGDEIKEFGFADETISTEDEANNKSEALAVAAEQFKALAKKMKDEELNDVAEVAALIKPKKPKEKTDNKAKDRLSLAKAKLKLHEKEI